MTAIPSCDARRVVASASLMSSAIDGEALGATRAVVRLLAKHELEPAGVIKAGLGPEAPAPAGITPEPPAPMPRRWAVMPMLAWEVKVRDLLAAPSFLNNWELSFLIKVSRNVRPSREQLAVVDRIAAEVVDRRVAHDER